MKSKTNANTNENASARMNLIQVGEWLSKHGYEEIASGFVEMFKLHPRITKDGMILKDVVESVFKSLDVDDKLFKELESEVPTYMEFIGTKETPAE